ncbi:hypothetical protein N7453_005682 [Penicillium expansum]|nr:hypothetical protein N7453_005682 [Penicillium expansum]
MESTEPSALRAESQEPRDITDGYDVSSDSLKLVESLVATESDESAVDVSPNEGTGFVGNIRRYLRLRRHNNHESASRRGGLGLVRQNAGFAGRHGGLGFRQRVREFASRQVDRYRQRRMLRQHDNALASQ